MPVGGPHGRRFYRDAREGGLIRDDHLALLSEFGDASPLGAVAQTVKRATFAESERPAACGASGTAQITVNHRI
jgi:hypothetical protein